MATEGSKQWRSQAVGLPPRTLDVRKYAESRASELESLHTIVSNRLNNDFRSRRNKRRRTTGFDTKNRRHHRKRKKTGEEERKTDEKKKLSRCVRRRIELKKNPETGFSKSSDGTKRLRTHVWHAKRFTMEKLWGFYLPLGLHGRGRGSRAILKWYKQGAVIHDASYYTPVQLEGPQESILSILSMLLVPSPLDHPEGSSKRILSGDIYGSAMLYHAEKATSKAICSVNYMWRPSLWQDNGVGTKEERTDEDNSELKTNSSSHFRRLWIWMHPSAFDEGFDCLKLACQMKMDDAGVLVDCVSLDGQFGRLEVMGSRAFQLLQKILYPCTSSLEDSGVLKSCSMVQDKSECEIEQKCVLQKEDCFSFNAVVSLHVVDPRFLSAKKSAPVPEAHLASDLCGLLEDETQPSAAGDLHLDVEVLSTLQSKYERNCSSNCKDLWDASKGVCPPMEENILCLERHKRLSDFFCLKDSTSGKFVSSEVRFSRFCPILLLRNTDQAGLLTGWSIILPMSWVKTFWIPLVAGGAHAIGLREKHWIACDMGLPYFPLDFPDCDAYSCYMAREAAAIDKQMESRPPAMRPFRVPVPPPWSSICFVSGNIRENGDHLKSEISRVQPVDSSSSSCGVIVARTSIMLMSFLKEISGDHLLVFPKGQDGKNFSHLIKDEAAIDQVSNVAAVVNHRRRLCYLRVHLHAYREGFFDEGAVVCAPHFSDLSLWTNRSENNEVGLQVPHAFVGSYFKELSSGKWEFVLPEDPAARESYRQPIGFVTTGFVRGSKKPTAVALCEAVLLADLRHEQWSQMPTKQRRKEIFVLVRNLRSTAYRLAHATIVLEEREEDVKSL